MSGEPLLEIAFTAQVIEWRGPAPFYFAAIPDDHYGAIREAAREASYGWGCVPVSASVNGTDFTTSLFPRDAGYMLPLKIKVRRAAGVALGDPVEAALTISHRRPAIRPTATPAKAGVQLRAARNCTPAFAGEADKAKA